MARTLGEAGVTCLELTLTTPGAVDALARVRAELGSDVALGMGSVIDAAQAAACLDAGADFLVSPGVCPEVALYALERGVPCYPGALTPSELIEAWGLGAPAVKLFPASLGGVRYLKDVRAPLPQIPLVPTGGVALEQISDYIANGAAAVGLGGPLVGDALDGGSLAKLAVRARLGAPRRPRTAGTGDEPRAGHRRRDDGPGRAERAGVAAQRRADDLRHGRL